MTRILIVDNEPDVRKTYSGFFNDEGYAVKTATNEGEALNAILQDLYDFALIDVRLHEETEDDNSGLSLAMALRSLKPQLRIIMLTRYIRANQIVRAIRYLGVEDFIEKTPDACNQILKTIKESEKTNGENKKLKLPGNASHLTVAIEDGQSITARSRGRHVCSVKSSKMIKIDLNRYTIKTELARGNQGKLRFQVEEIGRALWEQIFSNHPEILRSYVEARAKSYPLSMLIESSREFLQLPLEFTRSDEPNEYLILQHPVTRFICGAVPKREAISPQLLASTEKLRVLIIASNTYPPIAGVDLETQELKNFLKSQNFVEVDFIPTREASLDVVKEAIRNKKYDILHYAGHGFYLKNSPEESSLYFWERKNKQGEIKPITAAELKILLDRSDARLVYLSCCEGTASGGESDLLDDDFTGLADAIVQSGIPSVLGFRWPVSDEGAKKFAIKFYKSLLEQGSPELATWDARCESASDRNNTTWLSPILIHQS